MRWFAGMDRKRSEFGKWLEREEIAQLELSRISGVTQQTINRLATGEVSKPTRLTARKLMKAIREIDPDATFEDFWT